MLEKTQDKNGICRCSSRRICVGFVWSGFKLSTFSRRCSRTNDLWLFIRRCIGPFCRAKLGHTSSASMYKTRMHYFICIFRALHFLDARDSVHAIRRVDDQNATRWLYTAKYFSIAAVVSDCIRFSTGRCTDDTRRVLVECQAAIQRDDHVPLFSRDALCRVQTPIPIFSSSVF